MFFTGPETTLGKSKSEKRSDSQGEGEEVPFKLRSAPCWSFVIFLVLEIFEAWSANKSLHAPFNLHFRIKTGGFAVCVSPSEGSWK